MDELEFDAWVRAWAELWGVPDLAHGLRIERSPRLKRALGRCHAARGLVRLHPALFDRAEDFLREVVCHEVAHVAAYRLHGGRVRPHGTEWKELMRRAGYDPRARIPVTALPAGMHAATRTRKRWRHTCPVCGASRNAGRPVRTWRCRRCHQAGLGGRLEIRRVG